VCEYIFRVWSLDANSLAALRECQRRHPDRRQPYRRVLERVHHNMRETVTPMIHARVGRRTRKVRDEYDVVDTVHGNREPGSSVSTCLATGWTTGRSRFDPRQRQRIFPLTSVSRPTLGPTQPPVQWVPWALSPGLKRGRGVTLTTHPYLVPRSGSRRYTSSLPKRLRGV
jgi:hypothetical protein